MSVTVTQELTQQTVTVTGNPVENNVTVTVSNARGPSGGGGGSNSVTSATTSDGTANLDLLNVTTATAEVTGTLTANHIHGNLAGSVYAHVRAGEALLKGDPVYVSGFNNGTSTAEVSKADASNAAKMPAIGIMDANLAHNATGHMVITGTITDVNTAGYAVNAELYVAAGGGMTATPPTARAQPVARVERVNLNNGAIIVKVNGLSASDATPSTLVRRDASGAAEFVGLTVTGGTTFGDASLIQFDAVEYYYGTGAASAHRFALNGGAATGDALFTAASASAARTTLELGSTNTPTFGGLDLLTATTTTLNVYNSLSGANFERLSFRWASNIARIGTAKGGTGTARDLVLETDGTERMRVISTGSVGIGTASPTQRLDVLTATTVAARFRTSGSNEASILLESLSGNTGYVYQRNGANALAGFTGSNGFSVDIFGGSNSVSIFKNNGDVAIGGVITSTTTFAGSSMMIVGSTGNVGIGTTSPTALLDVNSNTLRLRTARTPASATAAGNAGDICWDADYIYVCTATNTWKRTAIATWP